MDKLGTYEYQDADNTLSIYANVHYEILWAEMGISGNLQSYIVKVTKKAIETKRTFSPEALEKVKMLPVGVSFQFR